MKGKKTLVALLLGVFVLTGVVIPYTAQANPNNNQPPAHGPGPDLMVQALSDDFGLNRDEVSKYLHQGVNPHDMMLAAMLSKASGKSLTDVLAMKTLANTWGDVEQSLGIAKEQIRDLHEDMIATKMAKSLSVSKDNVLDLMKSGYIPQDIATAAILAKKTQKPIADILSMKKINNQWSDVAQALGIDQETFRQEMIQNHAMMPNPEMHGPGGHPGNGMEDMRGEPGGL